MIGGLLFTTSVAVAVARSSLPAPTDLTDSRAIRTVEARTPARSEAAAPGVTFSDDFEDDPVGADPPKGWTIAVGRWNGVISNDTHVVQHAVGPYGQMIGGSRGWTDYTVSADVMPTPLKTGFSAVAGRYHDPGDYYQCDIHHASSVQLWRLRGGVATLLDNRPVAWLVPIPEDETWWDQMITEGRAIPATRDLVRVLEENPPPPLLPRERSPFEALMELRADER